MKDKKDISKKELRARLQALADSGDVHDSELAKLWRDDPTKVFHAFNLLTPKKIKELIAACINPRIPEVIVIGGRGVGKTLDIAIIEGCSFYFDEFDIVHLGGSEKQAKKGYGYFRNYFADDPNADTKDIGKTLTTAATGARGNWFQIVPCSEFAIRGEHAGDPHYEMENIIHGGMVVIDEEAVAKPGVVKAAFKTNNTARPRKTIRLSTDHVPGSTFANAVDNPGKAKVIKIDPFDVSEKCRASCKKCIPAFAGKLHPGWKEWLLSIGKDPKDPSGPRGYCEGKAKKHSPGHMLISELKYDFERDGREEFETEYMCMRPKGAGAIIPRDLLDKCLTGDMKLIAPMPGMPTAFCSDWGVGMTAMAVLQMQKDQTVALLDAQHLIGERTDVNLLSVASSMIQSTGARYGRADSSNPWLISRVQQTAGISVAPFVFSTDKEHGVGALRRLVEEGRLRIPGVKRGAHYDFPTPAFRECFEQLAGWKRDDNGKIVKKNDHYPDALLCIARDFVYGTDLAGSVSKDSDDDRHASSAGRRQRYPGCRDDRPGGFF